MKARLSLFGSYYPAENPLATRALVVDLAVTSGLRGVVSSGLTAEATVSAEALFVAAPTTAHFELRESAVVCRLALSDVRAAPWDLVFAWRPSARLARALTELSGTLRGPPAEPPYDVRLRVDWRTLVGWR